MSVDPQTQSVEEEKKGVHPSDEITLDLPPLDALPKGRWERAWPTIACGAGLFSDGYLNGVSTPVVLQPAALSRAHILFLET